MIPLRCTLAEARAIRARLDAALGYPRPARPEDRIGGGRHVPLDRAGTGSSVSFWAVRDSADVVVRALPEWSVHLRAADLALTVATDPTVTDRKDVEPVIETAAALDGGLIR